MNADIVQTEQNPVIPARNLTYAQLMLCAAAIGIVGGLVATIYYTLIETSIELVWHTLPAGLQTILPKLGIPIDQFSSTPAWILTVTTIGGLLVGITLRVMGLPGEVAFVVDQVHDPGRIDLKQTPAMVVASLLSITAGGSAGPEAPLVQVNGSLGGWLADTLRLTAPTIRILTFCGMSAALGAFFGAPLSGALFALEIPHQRGLEYYEALIPAILSAILSFVVFRLNTGLSIGGMYHFTSIPPLSLTNLAEGVLLGAIGVAVALLFVLIFRVVGWLTAWLHQRTIVLATIGGFTIGAIALLVPQTLFFGEREIDTILKTGATFGVSTLLLIALAKMLAISFTLHSGFRGGFIFPLFYIGAAVGMAIALSVPQIHPTISMICLMAAVNVAITKTPVSTTVILSVLSDTAMVPVLIIACLTSFLLTMPVSLIGTQRSRTLE